MQKLWTRLLVISIFMLVFTAPAFAQMSHMREGGDATETHHEEMDQEKERHDDACWMKSMTDEQKAKAAKMRLKFKKVKYHLKAQITVKKVELATLVTQDNPDQDAINKKIEEILDLKREKMQKKYAYKVALRGMLTPEQRVSFDMHMLKKAYHGKGHGHKGGHGYR